MKIKVIENEIFPNERDLAFAKYLTLFNCSFKGDDKNESSLKESEHININKCHFYLRYPLWHVNTLTIDDSNFYESARGSIWYSKKIYVNDTKFECPKLFRECKDINLINCSIKSDEFLWKCKDIKITNTCIEGEYSFFESENLEIKDLNLKGKYSLQYVKNLIIDNSVLTTKDAFWHSENVTITNSTLIGEYLGWYSNKLTIKNCKIISHQPLCYCKNLTLIDCELLDADFAFEKSEVIANINSEIKSVRKIKKGHVVATNILEYFADDCVYKNIKEIREK